LLELELWLPAGHVTPEHVHPRMEERWEVLVGLMRAFPDELALAVPLS
jgi:hypothetical protein